MASPFIYDPIKIIFTVLIAFIPSIIYAIVIRYSEKFEREPWGSIGQAFLWGGTLGIVLVILIRGFFDNHLEENYPIVASDLQLRTLVLMCVITPFAAELIKPIGLILVRGDILEAEDGLIYGAVIGLGYTATENLLYGIYIAPLYGIETFLTIVFMRSMSVMFIQSSTTALTCYGVTRAMKVKHKTGSYFAFPAFLLAAIGIHATFNYISFLNLFDVGDIIFSISSSLMFSIVFAFILMFVIYFKIYRLDRLDEKVKEISTQDRPRTRPEPMVHPRPGPRPRPRPPPPTRSRQPPRPMDDPYYDYDPYEPELYSAPPRGPPSRPGPRPGPRPRSQGFHYLYEPPTRHPRSRGPPPPPRTRAHPPPHTITRPPPRMPPSRPIPSSPRQQPQQPYTPVPSHVPRPPRSVPPPPPPPVAPAAPPPQKPKPMPVKEPSREIKKKPKKEVKIPEESEEIEDTEDVEVDWDM